MDSAESNGSLIHIQRMLLQCQSTSGPEADISDGVGAVVYGTFHEEERKQEEKRKDRGQFSIMSQTEANTTFFNGRYKRLQQVVMPPWEVPS